jgi:hypothetical protein
MKDRHLLFGAIVFAFSGRAPPPEGQGTGKVTDKGKLEFKFEDSCKNSGTRTITKSGDDIIVSVSASRKADPGCVAFYGSNIRLKRVKK